MKTDAAKDLLFKLLEEEGQYDKYIKLLRRGKTKEALEITERIVADHRAEFDKVLQ
jgi:hypothetical protein